MKNWTEPLEDCSENKRMDRADWKIMYDAPTNIRLDKRFSSDMHNFNIYHSSRLFVITIL